MNTVTDPNRISLYFREGHSDKVYQAAIEPEGDLFRVTFAYGRRGSTLSTGTKTSAPVPYATAKLIFGKLVQEKTAKGYTPGESGMPYQGTTSETRVTGLLPQLLNAIDSARVEELLADDDWWMQEKMDGRRVLIAKTGSDIVASNRKGLAIGLPEPIHRELLQLPADFVLDGECVGEVFHVFDALQHNDDDLRPIALKARLVALINLVASAQCPHVPMVQSACDTVHKRRLLGEIRQANGEGVVFKNVAAPYLSGRPNSGGPALKHKFTATLSAVVSTVNTKRSVGLKLRGKQGWQSAGNLTIPPGQEIPREGDIVEVRYLYAFPESGVLFQPVWLGLRTDLDSSDCTAQQLKFKPQEESEGCRSRLKSAAGVTCVTWRSKKAAPRSKVKGVCRYGTME